MPKTGYIEGSYDQVNWVKLTEWNNLPSPPDGVFREHLFDGSNYSTGNQHVSLSEIEFLLNDSEVN